MEKQAADLAVRSITDPIGIGFRRGVNGEPGAFAAMINITRNVLVTGGPGAGCTTVMRTILAEVLRCDNALAWGIDTAGGGLGALGAGEDDDPKPLDWLVVSDAGAQRMLTEVGNIIRARMPLVPARTWSCGPDSPALVVFVDDASPAVVSDLVAFADLGRRVGIYFVVRARPLRAEVTTKALLSVFDGASMAMRPRDTDSLYTQFGQSGLGYGALSTAGAGWLRQDHGGALSRFDATVRSTDDIMKIAELTRERRPHLDEMSFEGTGPAYQCRWDDVSHRVDEALLFSEITEARTAGQRAVDLGDAQRERHHFVDQAALVAFLDEAAAAGRLVRVDHPTDPVHHRYYIPGQEPNPEVASMAANGLSIHGLRHFLAALVEANEDLAADNLAFVSDGDGGRRIVAYLRPVTN